jgi:hypothetical protein
LGQGAPSPCLQPEPAPDPRLSRQDNADLVRRLAEQGHEPQVTWAADGPLAELEQRIDWTKSHLHLVE